MTSPRTRSLITRAAVVAALAGLALVALVHLLDRADEVHRRNYCASLATPTADRWCGP